MRVSIARVGKAMRFTCLGPVNMCDGVDGGWCDTCDGGRDHEARLDELSGWLQGWPDHIIWTDHTMVVWHVWVGWWYSREEKTRSGAFAKVSSS